MQAGNKIEIFIDLPLEVTGLVVGKKGATINKIKSTSKANVVLANDPLPTNAKCKRLNIQGSKFEVDNARDQVVKLLCGWCATSPEGNGEGQKNLDLLPAETRNIVLAFKGNRQQNGHEASSHATKPPSQHAESSPGMPPSVQPNARPNQSPARGPPQPKMQDMPANEDNRNGAAHMYVGAGMLNGQQDRPVMGPTPEVQMRPPDIQLRAEVEVPKACIRYIVGQNYENIVQWERTSRAQIFPVEEAMNENPNTIRIAFVGDEQAIFVARQLLIHAVNEWSSRVQHCMQAFQTAAPNNPPALQPGMQAHPALHLGQPPSMPLGMNVNMLSQPAHLQQQAMAPLGSAAAQRPMMSPPIEPHLAHQQVQPPKPVVHQTPTQDMTAGQGHVRQGGNANARPEKSAAAPSGQTTEKVLSRLEFRIPTAAAGMIVGKKGAQIKKFKQECNVHVFVNKEEEGEGSTTKTVVVEGSGPALDKGLLMLCETLALWAENANQDALHKQADYWMKELKSQEQPSAKAHPMAQSATQANSPPRAKKANSPEDSAAVKVELIVPVETVPWIVGKQGKTINMFKKDTGCNIALAHDSEVSDPSRKKLIMQGTRQQYNLAKSKIVDFLANSKMQMGAAVSQDADARAVHQARVAWLQERIEEHVVPFVRSHEGQQQAAHGHQEGQHGNNKNLSNPSAQTQSVAPGRIEMHITKASAAMIIGRKGTMHKTLQLKTGATITLEQEALADGRKRLVIEGTEEQVSKAKRSVDDILRQCDDDKYEETERKKQAEEEEKRRLEEAAKKTKKDEQTRRQAQEQAQREAAEKEANRKQEEERRWKEKQEKAARDAEKKRLFQEKVASNPFAFLVDDDEAEEEVEEAEQASPVVAKEPGSSKKKKKRGGKGGEGATSAPAEAAAGPAHAEAAAERGEKAAAKEAEQVEPEGEGEERDSSDSGVEVSDITGMGSSSEGCVTLHVASLSRRGTEHNNEDRALSCDLTDLLSEPLKTTLLERSVSKKIPVFAVFDGHGGPGAAEFCKENLLSYVVKELEQSNLQGGAAIGEALTKGFAQLEEGFRSHANQAGDRSGTCAVCVVVMEEEGVFTLHSANVGDCRAVIGRRDEPGKVTAVKLTEDHRAVYAQERKRIEAAGGKIEEKRAMGDLIPSRTIGDFKTKAKCPGAVIATPQIACLELTPADKYLILASDGLWDDLKLTQVMDILGREKAPDAANKALYGAVTRKCGASKVKSKDDITIITVYL